MTVGGFEVRSYASLNEHRPIYIDAHLKGDFDKPFRPPRQKLYIVAREENRCTRHPIVDPRAHRPRATSPLPLFETDWPLLQDALAWLERLRALLEGCGGVTDEEQLVLKKLVHELLWFAASLYDAPAVTMTPRRVPDPAPAPAPPPSGNGDRTATIKRWSLNERLQELGYPEEVSRSARIKLGQAVVEAYKQAHGKAPMIADRGSGAQAKRVSLYEAADLPMVDRMVREMLGEPGIEPQAQSLVEGGAHDAGVADTPAS